MPLRFGLVVALGLAAVCSARADEAVRRDGTRVPGTLRLTEGRFAFGDLPMAELDLVRFPTRPPSPVAALLVHQVRIGHDEHFLAEVRSLDATHLHVRPTWTDAIAVPRPFIERVAFPSTGRPLLFDPFQGDLTAWTVSGGPRTTDGRLVLDRAGQAVEKKWNPPRSAGRVEIQFESARSMTRRLVLELDFVQDGKSALLRIDLVGPAEHFVVDGPGKPSHEGRLPRRTGPQRLSVEFDRSRLNVDLGQHVLWTRDESAGSLRAIRLVADGAGTESASVEELLVAQPMPATGPRDWASLTTDAIRSADDDEKFGDLLVAGPTGVTFQWKGQKHVLDWPNVAEFTFRRAAVPAEATSGEHVQVRVRTARGIPDVLNGVVTAFDHRHLKLTHAVLGPLTIPRDRVTELRFHFRGRRIPVDGTPRHLGTRTAFGYAVPRPEGLQFAKTVTVDPVPTAGFVVVEAARLSGAGTPVELLVNGERIGQLNRFADRPDAVVRSYRLPVPAATWRKEMEVAIRLRPGTDGKPVSGVDVRAVRLEVEP